MLLKVAKDDDKAIPNDKNWLLRQPPKGCTDFLVKLKCLANFEKVYSGSKFNELLIAKQSHQSEDEVFETLLFLSKRVEGMECTPRSK